MKDLLGLLMLGCSASSEPTASQKEAWPNYCYFDYYDTVDLPSCTSLVHFHCKDGDSQWIYLPAEGSNWIGTTCYQDPDHTYVYVCVDDHTTFRAEVRCDK